MSDFVYEWEVDDFRGSTPRRATIPMSDLADCESENEVLVLLETYTEEEFRNNATWVYSGSAEDDAIEAWKEARAQ